jgi:hypothetical protein
LHLFFLTWQALVPAATPTATTADPVPEDPAAKEAPTAPTAAGQPTPNNTWNIKHVISMIKNQSVKSQAINTTTIYLYFNYMKK